MVATGDILLRARLDATSLETWVEAGWLVPRGGPGAFDELDIARACLIRDLGEGLGVNEEGVAIVLDLVDQLHGLRLALHRVTSAIQALPEPLRGETLRALRGTAVGVPAERFEGEGEAAPDEGR